MDVALLFREYVRLDRLRETGLTPAELYRWQLLKRKLSQHFSPGLGDSQADRRDSLRVPVRMRVSFRSEGELAESLMTNLSRRGVFIETEHPLAIGEHIELRIHVEHPDRELVVPAEVVSHVVGPRLSLRRGMGLRLHDVDPETDARLADLYERVVK